MFAGLASRLRVCRLLVLDGNAIAHTNTQPQPQQMQRQSRQWWRGHIA
jgi:hypothetical protein